MLNKTNKQVNMSKTTPPFRAGRVFEHPKIAFLLWTKAQRLRIEIFVVSIVIFFLILSVVLVGCSKDLNQNEMERQSLITGKVIGQKPAISTDAIITTTTSTITTTTANLPDVSANTKVSRVIDGDTIELESGERVRLLGINTPEKGQPYYEEATNRLKEMIDGRTVELENDVDNKDQYGRLLRYVFFNNENVNIKMIEEGYATVYVFPPNVKYKEELKQAWNECLNKKINLCKSPEPDGQYICDSSCIGIAYFNWNADGDDCVNLNGEYVKFQNSCSFSCDMTQWTIKDESSREPYSFPEFILENWKSVILYTGCGTNTNAELYWCSSGKTCNSVWNNDKDTLYLRNSNSELVLSYSYP